MPARLNRADVLLIAGVVGTTPMRALFEAIPLARGQERRRPHGPADPRLPAEHLHEERFVW